MAGRRWTDEGSPSLTPPPARRTILPKHSLMAQPHRDFVGTTAMPPVEKIRQVQLVGRKIRQLRKEHKLTQVELSARLGIQQSDLSRMEQGEYRDSLDTLFRILAEFKMGMGEFFEEIAK